MGRWLVVGANPLTVTAGAPGNMAGDWHVDADDQQVFLLGAGYADLRCISDRFMSSLFRVHVQPYFLPVELQTPFVSGVGFMSESVSTWRGERKTLTGNGSGFLSFP